MGKQWKQWQTFFSWAPESLQISDCSQEIKRRLLLRRKAMTNLELSLGPEYVFLAGKLYKPNSQAVPSVLLLRVAAGVEKGVSASAQ